MSVKLKRPTDGLTYNKLTAIEKLEQAILEQAVQDITQTRWVNESVRYFKCSNKEGLEAVDYVIYILRENAYSKEAITKILKSIVPREKYDLVKNHLKGRYEL